MGEQKAFDDEALKADLVVLFEKHGCDADTAESLATKTIKLANGAELAYKVPVVGYANYEC